MSNKRTDKERLDFLGTAPDNEWFGLPSLRATTTSMSNKRTDKERLDFLGTAPDNVRFIVYPLQPFEGDRCCVQALEHYRFFSGGYKTIREAIDSAMKALEDD